MMLDRLKRPFRQQSQDGYILLLTLITTTFMFISLSGILSLSLINLSSAKRTVFDTNALYAAESGVDNAVYQINATAGTYAGTNSVCPITTTGTVSPVDVFDDPVKGHGTYETCVVSGQPGMISHELILYVVGKVYRTMGATTNPVSVRKLRVVIEGSPVGAYAVQTGPGGMIMRNGANISQGPVYIGGYLNMSNTASIGTPTVSIPVSVANARCPVGGGATYPTVCNAGTSPNPITITGSQAHIYGAVSANDQTNPYATSMTNTGLVATSGVSAPSLPVHDRAAQMTAVTTTLASTSPLINCSGSGPSAINAVTWPANVKIVGDLTLTNSCTITVSGDAWITGDFQMRNSAVIKTGPSVTVQPTIMVDGSNGVKTTQTSSLVTNAAQIGMEFITYYSTNACSTAATVAAYCAGGVISGSELYASKDHVTIDIGNQGAAAGSVFYARWSKVTIGQAGTIGALLGQTIDLGQSGNLTFTSTVVTGNYAYDVRYYEFATW